MDGTLFLAPATDRSEAYGLFHRSVLEGIPKSLYGDHLGCDYGKYARIWGLTSGLKSMLQGVDVGDLILFYTEPNLYSHAARVEAVEECPELGESIRERYLDQGGNSDREWDLLLILDEPNTVSISGKSVSELLGYKNHYPSRFIRVPEERLERLEAEFGDLETFVKSITE